MANKYDSFIELTPGYESVVDISSDSRNADFWSRYIVNDDMVTAVRLLAKSLRPDDPMRMFGTTGLKVRMEREKHTLLS